MCIRSHQLSTAKPKKWHWKHKRGAHNFLWHCILKKGSSLRFHQESNLKSISFLTSYRCAPSQPFPGILWKHKRNAHNVLRRCILKKVAIYVSIQIETDECRFSTHPIGVTSHNNFRHFCPNGGGGSIFSPVCAKCCNDVSIPTQCIISNAPEAY